jgi:uncharacterized membrane protein
MLPLIDWILHGVDLFIKHGLTTTTILGLTIFGIRQTIKNRKIQRRMRKYVPWLIPDDESEVKEYVANQHRIEMKVDLLLRERGITWNVITIESGQKDSLRDSKSYLASPYLTKSTARFIGRFTNWRRKKTMPNINKAILLPLLSAIALFVKHAFGYEIADEWINIGADVILYILMLIGLFIKPKKDKPKEADNDFITPIEPRL